MTDAAVRALAPLPRSFYARPTVDVAHELLGKLLVRRPNQNTYRVGERGLRPREPVAGGHGDPLRVPIKIARIVEVEAYLGERDAASHARRGPTPRAAIMFGPPGLLYVYLVYGMHHCMNFVTETDGVAGAVLVRAAEPVAGLATAGRPTTGPGKLCAALAVTVADKGLDVTRAGELFVADDGTPAPRRAASPRIGVDYAGNWAARRLRFFVPRNPYVCKP